MYVWLTFQQVKKITIWTTPKKYESLITLVLMLTISNT